MNFADFVREHSEIIETITKAGGFTLDEIALIEDVLRSRDPKRLGEERAR